MAELRVLELFCGTKSFSNAAEELGYKTFTVDWDSEFNPDLSFDITELKIEMIPEEFQNPDIIWASPPCTCFSVASIGTHWGGGWREYKPRTKEAVMAKKLVRATVKLIAEFNPRYYFIENPRGVLRKLGLIPGAPDRHLD